MPFGDTAWLSIKYYYTCSVIKSINLLIYFPETCEIIFRKIFSHLSSIRIWATASLHLAHNKNSTVRFYDNNRYDTFSLNWHTVASIKGVRVAEHFTSDGAAVRVTSSNTSLADPPNLRVSTLIQASRLEWDMTFRPRDQSSLLEVEGPNSIMSAVTSEREPRNNRTTKVEPSYRSIWTSMSPNVTVAPRRVARIRFNRTYVRISRSWPNKRNDCSRWKPFPAHRTNDAWSSNARTRNSSVP